MSTPSSMAAIPAAGGVSRRSGATASIMCPSPSWPLTRWAASARWRWTWLGWAIPIASCLGADRRNPLWEADGGAATVPYRPLIPSKGNVELEPTELPPSNKVLLFQAVVTNGTGKTYWYMRPSPPTCWRAGGGPSPHPGLQALSSASVQPSSRVLRISRSPRTVRKIRSSSTLEALFNENTAAEALNTCDAQPSADSASDGRSLGAEG